METYPLTDALKHIPADFNPGGAVTTVAVRVGNLDGARLRKLGQTP